MNRPDWREWKHTPDVTVWQACALSLDIDPYIMLMAVDQRLMNAYPEKGPFFLSNVFPSRDMEKEYLLRVRLLSANLPNYALFPTRYRDRWNKSRREGNSLVRLSEFASWAVSVVEWEGLPPQLVELATAAPLDATAAPQASSLSKPPPQTPADPLESPPGHFMSLREVLTRMAAGGSTHEQAAEVLRRLLEWLPDQRDIPEWWVSGPDELWVAEGEDKRKPWKHLVRATYSGLPPAGGHGERAFSRFGFSAREIIGFLAKHGIDISQSERRTASVSTDAGARAGNKTSTPEEAPEPKADPSPWNEQPVLSENGRTAASELLPDREGEQADSLKPDERRENHDSATATKEPRLGITKKEILAVEWPLRGSFSQESLERALSDVPQWLIRARVSKGSPGKASSLWNPAMVAACLVAQKHSAKKALDRFISSYFSDWLAEWDRCGEML